MAALRISDRELQRIAEGGKPRSAAVARAALVSGCTYATWARRQLAARLRAIPPAAKVKAARLKQAGWQAVPVAWYQRGRADRTMRRWVTQAGTRAHPCRAGHWQRRAIDRAVHTALRRLWR
jgi:hypothetical protein